MSKKNFKDKGLPGFTFSGQDTQDTQEALNTHDTHDTQADTSKKKTRQQKHPRINMAFYGDNLEYLQGISRLEGVSVTEYVNKLIDADKAAKADILAQARDLLKGVK